MDAPPIRSQRNDPEVYPTIKDILDKHIDAHGILPIYFFVCDNSDGKEAARHKLFTNKWYQESQLENWIMFVYEIEDTENHISSYYIGLLIHADHPNVETYPGLFEEFMISEVVQGKVLNGRRV